MTQTQIDQAVAKATGDSLFTVQQRGFSLADPTDVDFDPEPSDGRPEMVDWDALEVDRTFLW